MPDQSPLPVGKTASGGELSRILIALQLSLGDDRLPGTLVFDEVEAGLGGKNSIVGRTQTERAFQTMQDHPHYTRGRNSLHGRSAFPCKERWRRYLNPHDNG